MSTESVADHQDVDDYRDVDGEQRAGGFGSLGSVIGLLVLTWAAAIASRPLNDNSFFTHLATGRLILDRGSVPARDPYLFTATDEPWTVQSWLASVGYATAERLGGEVGLRLLVCVVYLLAAALLWRLTAPAASLLVRLSLIAGALFVATGLWTERPYMVGVIGVALVWLALDDRFRPWALVPVLWVWGNTHGSFFFAAVLVTLVVVGGALDRGWGRLLEVPQHERRTGAAVAIGTLLVAVGPLGGRALTFPLVAARRSDVFSQVTEWKSPAFRSASELAYLVFVVFAVTAFARWGRSWRLILPAAAFIAGSLYAQRNIVIATVVLVGALAHVIPAMGTLRAADRPALGRLLGGVGVAVLVVVVAGTALTPAKALDDYAGRPIAWLERADDATGHVAADVQTGNLLTVLDGQPQSVFVDDRFDLLPDEVFEDYLVLLRGRSAWEQVLERHAIDTVVWARADPLATLLAVSDSWRIAYVDPSWVVATRRSPAEL